MRLELEGNPLTCIPPQIKNKGYKDVCIMLEKKEKKVNFIMQILVYLKQLQEGATIWGRLKVMLVGQEGVVTVFFSLPLFFFSFSFRFFYLSLC
jgi:hypothetical protein